MSADHHFPSPVEILTQTGLYLMLDLGLETKDEAIARLVREQRREAVERGMRAGLAKDDGSAPLQKRDVSRPESLPSHGGGAGLPPSPPAPPVVRLEAVKAFRGPMDAFCVDCGTERPFKGADRCLTSGPEAGMFSMLFRCQWK